MQRFNVSLWFAYVFCLAAVTGTALLYVIYPQLKIESEKIYRQNIDERTVHNARFEPVWFITNLTEDFARFGIPLMAVISVFFASSGAANAKALRRGGVKHPLTASRFAIYSPYPILALGVVMTHLAWSMLK